MLAPDVLLLVLRLPLCTLEPPIFSPWLALSGVIRSRSAQITQQDISMMQGNRAGECKGRG